MEKLAFLDCNISPAARTILFNMTHNYIPARPRGFLLRRCPIVYDNSYNASFSSGQCLYRCAFPAQRATMLSRRQVAGPPEQKSYAFFLSSIDSFSLPSPPNWEISTFFHRPGPTSLLCYWSPPRVLKTKPMLAAYAPSGGFRSLLSSSRSKSLAPQSSRTGPGFCLQMAWLLGLRIFLHRQFFSPSIGGRISTQ